MFQLDFKHALVRYKVTFCGQGHEAKFHTQVVTATQNRVNGAKHILHPFHAVKKIIFL